MVAADFVTLSIEEHKEFERIKRSFKEIMAYVDKHDRAAMKYLSAETLNTWEEIRRAEHPYFDGIPMP